MGSGAKGNYGEGGDGSQPYAPTYHVVQSMREMDINNNTYHNGRYDKNPTASNIDDMIKGGYIVSKTTNIDMPYVIDKNGNIIVGKCNGNGRDSTPTPHPTLIGGKDSKVQMAGIVKIRGGKIVSYDDRSGHYRPSKKSMEVADKAFRKLPSILFRKKGNK